MTGRIICGRTRAARRDRGPRGRHHSRPCRRRRQPAMSFERDGWVGVKVYRVEREDEAEPHAADIDTLGPLRDRIARRYGEDAAQDAIAAYLALRPRPPLSEAGGYCWVVARWRATDKSQQWWNDTHGRLRLIAWDFTESEPPRASTAARQLDRAEAREALHALNSEVVAYYAGLGPRRLRCSKCRRYLQREGATWSCSRKGCRP